MTIICAVADDATGAAGLAGDFARLGLSACTVTTHALEQWSGETADRAIDVVVVDTDSRSCSEAESIERHEHAVTLLMKRFPALMIVKIDSLLRGHPGANLAAVLRAACQDHALAICAIPEHGRTVKGGRLYVGDEALTNLATGAALDVVGAFEGVDQVHRWPSRASSPERGVTVADVDSAIQRKAALEWALTGGVRIIAATYGIAQPVASWLSSRPGRAPVLILCGSVSETARRQVAYLCRERRLSVLEMDPPAGGEDLLVRVEDAANRAKELLATGADLLIQTWPSGAAALPPDDFAAQMLEAFCRRLLPQVGRTLGAAIATGGATAAAFLQAADATGTVCAGVEVEECAPLLRVVGGPLDGLPLLTKPGSFGSDFTLVSLLDAARLAALTRSTLLESLRSLRARGGRPPY